MQLLRLVTAFMLVTTLLLISPLTCTVASNTAAVALSSTFTLTVIVEPPNGGWLTLSPGTYVFEANTVVQIYWWHSPDYILEFYDINGTILGPEQITRPYNITMDANYVLKAIFLQVAPLQVSLSQLLNAPSEDGWVSFAATTYGGRGQKTCMWYLNNTRVTTRLLDADSDSWSFVPSTPGTYHIFVKASSEWSVGDIVKSETLNVTFCTLLYETQYAFSVESNSTVSALSYGSDNRTLSFMVTGMEETLGYAKVNVDKRLVPNVELLKVYVGEVEHNYTATEEADSLIIMFTYSHSVHQVEIELDYTIAELQTPFLLLGLVAASLLLVATRRRVRS